MGKDVNNPTSNNFLYCCPLCGGKLKHSRDCILNIINRHKPHIPNNIPNPDPLRKVSKPRP